MSAIPRSLTVCPLSNVRLRVHKSVAESPIPKLLAAGVPFSINSDDPSYFGGYILASMSAPPPIGWTAVEFNADLSRLPSQTTSPSRITSTLTSRHGGPSSPTL